MSSTSDSEDDTDIRDIEQLTAVLTDEATVSECISQASTFSGSIPSGSKANSQELTKIEMAIALNKLTDEKFRKFECILINRLNECRSKLTEIHNVSLGDKPFKREYFRYVQCGKPYFKDKANFPAPDNEDTILMKKSVMFDFSDLSSPGWTIRDKTQFISLILHLSQDIKKKELNSEIAALKRKHKADSKYTNQKLEKDTAVLKTKISMIRKMNLEEVVLPIEAEYDWDLIANKMNYRHSAEEYRALWKLFLHPSIKKTCWNKKEHNMLQDIAYKYNLQNWEEIAKELNTGRTGYQCFVYFRTNMGNTFTGQKWTRDEEEYLKRLIEYYREDNYIPWGKVAASMQNRTKIQIYNKHFRLEEQRKGRFLPEEDAVILTCLEKFGPNFKKMKEYLPSRSVIQLRTRYQTLKQTKVSITWTQAEDRRLLQLLANQESQNFSSIVQYFQGKSRLHLRSRYLTLTSWIKRNPNVDIAHAPRRFSRRLGHGRPTISLNNAVESLKSRIRTEVEFKKATKITMKSPEHVIEDAIIANIVNCKRFVIQMISSDKVSFEDAADSMDHSNSNNINIDNLRKLLILLKAKLDKKKFELSYFKHMYSELLEPDQQLCSVKIKSYSKKQKVTTVNISNTPDIWGDKSLVNTMYVLPPNYATITGCKKLLTSITASSTYNPFNLTTLIKRNTLLREQYYMLEERLNFLFTWPMMLSNREPNKRIEMSQEKIEKKACIFEKLRIPVAAVAIPNYSKPYVNRKKEKNEIVTENIDLDDTLDRKDTIITIENETMY